MRHQTLPLFVVLSAVLSFARTASDKDAALAAEGARQLHDSVQNPDSLQVSRALITGKNICIDYRSRNGSGGTGIGVAVYETDKNLLFLDNSWIWQRTCLFGKYAQRREGADVTDAVRDALKKPKTGTLSGKEQPVMLPVSPVAPKPSPAPSTYTAVTPTGTVTTPTAQPVATAPVEPPLSAVKADTVVEARIATGAVARPPAPLPPLKSVMVAHPSAPATSTLVRTAPATVATAAAAPQPVAAPVETHSAGAVIIGPGGVAPGSPPSEAPESLGDAARRLKRERLLQRKRQTP